MTGAHVDAVARFTADWQRSLRSGQFVPPSIAEYVPDGTQARIEVLTELLRIDLRERWAASLGKRITEYCKEFPEVEHSPGLADLACEEFLARRRIAALAIEDFLAEYPDLAAEVRKRLAAFAIDDSTSVGLAESTEAVAALADLAPGRRIDDFDLLTDLGSGLLGRVFLARQRSMQRLVAVRLSAGRAAAPHTMAQLDHAHIVRVFDQRLLSTPTDAAHTLLGAAAPRLVYMQYLPGGTAIGVLEQRRIGPESAGGALLLRAVDAAMEAKGEIRPTDSSVRAEIAGLSWPETVAWVGRRLADALDHAAHHDVLHHDIKPANVLFTAEGIPKLADFALRETGARPTAESTEITDDSLPYCSPEQLARLLDPAAPAPSARSDIYSLGVLLWEMLTGTPPFENAPRAHRTDTYTAMLAERRNGIDADALARLPADTPASLRRVLLECLHADPKRRWRNGSELAGQLDLCLDAHARDLVDPPPNSLARRSRGWLVPWAAVCIGVPNVLASVYNIRLNQSLIIDRMAAVDQQKFQTIGLIHNLIFFPIGALLLIYLTRRVLTVEYRLARGREYSARTLAKARRDTLQMGDWAVLVPFSVWMIAGIVGPTWLALSGIELPPKTFLHFFTAQVVCAVIVLAYPFFPAALFAVRSVYPRLLARGGIGPGDERQLRNLARRANFYLGAAASVPLLGVASATFVDADDLGLVIVPVRALSVGGILAFVVTYRMFRLLEADLLALARAIPQRKR